jgi:hypothetical protein
MTLYDILYNIFRYSNDLFIYITILVDIRNTKWMRHDIRFT